MASGKIQTISNEIIEPKQMADLLIAQGMEPEILGLKSTGELDLTYPGNYTAWHEEFKNPIYVRVKVEYDIDYTGGNYNGVGSMIELKIDMMIEQTVKKKFKETTGLDPAHIIHYFQVEDEYYLEE